MTADATSPSAPPPPPPAARASLLEVVDLRTHFASDRGTVRAVDGVSFTLERGRTLGVVGESGSGKTVLSRSIMGLLPTKNVRRSGQVLYEGTDIAQRGHKEMERVWGAEMAMVFQDPMTSLNPVMRIGDQITESLRYHLRMDGSESRQTAVALLGSVGIPEPVRRFREYPHQLSGGMRQRVTIAIALACGPKLLFADEPTTALDVTVQAQILDLLADQQRERHMAMVLVSHDLGVVAGRTDEILVMYGGRVVEHAPTDVLFSEMRMPYTEALLRSIPRIEYPSHTRLSAIPGRPPDLVAPPKGCNFAPRCRYAQPKCREEDPPMRTTERDDHRFRCWFPVGTPEGEEALARNQAGSEVAVGAPTTGRAAVAGSGTAHLRPAEETLLRAENLVVRFPVGSTGLSVNAVSDVSLDVRPRETLGLVGESGCGKSTTGKAMMHMPRPTSGEVRFDQKSLGSMSAAELRQVRPQMQMIFQDPISSLNPRRKVGDIVAEPLRIWGRGTAAEQRKLVGETLEAVGIDPAGAMGRRPHQFSGGQCQRISIARALMLDPKLVICDEPVSALDVSVQAQILNLLEDMKQRYGLTMVFIAHDLAVVKNVSDRVAVMYLGKLCEVGEPDELYARPAHPYTAALLESIPVPDPSVRPSAAGRLSGELPSPVAPPSGCRFRTRCPRAEELCAKVEPTMQEVEPGHHVACHFPLEHPGAATATTAAPVSDDRPPPPAPPSPAAGNGSGNGSGPASSSVPDDRPAPDDGTGSQGG